ncbi:hypothetical protein CAP35_05585 [Chitinophagaceae bacterium IBVUCB1]|nr:hypothetical protein CAP35_05585 [Chitinophagaceae bacterium IBVUCB1]
MTLHAFIQYLQYRWKAKTRHGIHSPFVYAFIDNCLGRQSTLTLEQRISEYFGDAIKWAGDGFDVEPGDSLFVLGVKNIHTTKENTLIWNTLCNDTPGFIISIDLFSIGLLIYNPDIKEKQHYVLQYPL